VALGHHGSGWPPHDKNKNKKNEAFWLLGVVEPLPMAKTLQFLFLFFKFYYFLNFIINF
jgi:hypothetical protein